MHISYARPAPLHHLEQGRDGFQAAQGIRTWSGAALMVAAKAANWQLSAVVVCSTALKASGGRSSVLRGPSAASRSRYSLTSLSVQVPFRVNQQGQHVVSNDRTDPQSVMTIPAGSCRLQRHHACSYLPVMTPQVLAGDTEMK